MLYFAYGSNLSETQMRDRCPAATVVGRAWLPDHHLVFSGFSKIRKGAVADAVAQAGSKLPRLIYAMTGADWEELDWYEGCTNNVYRRHRATVLDEGANSVDVWIYSTPSPLPPGQPSPEYCETIRCAYERLGFGPIAAE